MLALTGMPGLNPGESIGSPYDVVSGTTPAHVSSSASGLSSSSAGGPALGRCFRDRQREDRRRFQLASARGAGLAPATGQEFLRERLERDQPFVRVGDGQEAAEHHHRLVVGRVLEDRARDHEPVDGRDRQAGGRAAGDVRIARLAVEPWMYTLSPTRA